MTKMLIMSALICPGGYARQVFQAFAGSLLATGFDGDITIMTSTMYDKGVQRKGAT
ncbi:MAG: hypothetical protein ACI9YO_002252 [Gammaproteobacteria bacterium]|jgi:hypothetical protein